MFIGCLLLLQRTGASVIRVWSFRLRHTTAVREHPAGRSRSVCRSPATHGRWQAAPAQFCNDGCARAHHAGALQNLDMLRRRRQRNRKRLRQLSHRPFSPRQIAQHLPARGITKSVKKRDSFVTLLVQSCGAPRPGGLIGITSSGRSDLHRNASVSTRPCIWSRARRGGEL